MNQREYDRLRAEANADYRRKLEAIETVWKMSGGSQNGAKASGASIGKGALQQAVTGVLALLPAEFTLRDVEKQIRSTRPELAGQIKRPSLSSALKRLADDEQIVVVVTGRGKRASTYRRAG